MPIPQDFVRSLKFIHPQDIARVFAEKSMPRKGILFELVNEVRPVDLYCYLGGRFGQPNGIQNFLRSDDSDNLIHWEWTLQHLTGFISFQGMNFRTEIHLRGDGEWSDSDRAELIRQIREDFAQHGAEIGLVRKALENWVEFVNPYQRIRRAMDSLLKELKELDLRPDMVAAENPWDPRSVDDPQKWKDTAALYSRAFGLCFGIRSMLPVLAEAFVNLVIYLLMRPEIRKDQRLWDNVFRQPIDVRIKSLSLNCNGFRCSPDYGSDPCRSYHSLVNERNDLLHGNVVIDKLKFNEVHFFGKVPVFREYRSLWERSLGVEMKAVGLERVHDEVKVVDNLIDYLLSCLSEKIQREAGLLVNRYELAVNTKTNRIGVLFPPRVADLKVVIPASQAGTSESTDDKPPAVQNAVADSDNPAAGRLV
jgi:hypothetical protein